jgi:hypothetical protein
MVRDVLPDHTESNRMNTTNISLTCPHCGHVTDRAIVSTPDGAVPQTGSGVSVCGRCLKPAMLVDSAAGDPMLTPPTSCQAMLILGSDQYRQVLIEAAKHKPVVMFGLSQWVAAQMQEHDRAHD